MKKYIKKFNEVSKSKRYGFVANDIYKIDKLNRSVQSFYNVEDDKLLDYLQKLEILVGATIKKMMKEFEVELKFKGKKPKKEYESEYGFGTNPPIVLLCKSKSDVLKKLKLPKYVKVKRLKEV